MRAAPRSRRTEEEGESAFISMTDMAVSFLFIVMILLAFFATQINREETVPKELLDQLALSQEITTLQRQIEMLEAELDKAKQALQLSPGEDLVRKIRELRAEIDQLNRLLDPNAVENPIEHYNRLASTELSALLLKIRARITQVDDKIDVTISDSRDALHFAGDGLFLPKQSIPTKDGRERLRKIADILDEEIGCFSFGGRIGIAEECNPHAVMIEALLIEGHTDTDGADIYNMRLSANRAAEAFAVMVADRPDLLAFVNLRRQPVLSVAGYGKGRTISDEAQPGGKDANRRIDIRFIMYTPANEVSIPLGVDDLTRVGDLLAREPQ